MSLHSLDIQLQHVFRQWHAGSLGNSKFSSNSLAMFNHSFILSGAFKYTFESAGHIPSFVSRTVFDIVVRPM